MKLEPPASHHLSSAQGWLELGNAAEAEAELRLISQEFQDHPEIMEMRWQVLAQLKRWPECLGLAVELLKIAEGKSASWIHRAYAMHEMGDTLGAMNALIPALARFPDSWLVRYNLACYYCRLNKREEALSILEQAIRLGDVGNVKSMALNDPDLLEIREQIAGIASGGHA